jgi:hypothetical protein
VVAVFASTLTAGLTAPGLTIGTNLTASTNIQLSEPAPPEGLKLAIRSDDPGLLFAPRPDVAGTPSLVLELKPGMRQSPEFWVQASGETRQALYTAEAEPFGSAQGTVEITPSAIVLMGPHRAPGFQTTPRATASKLAVYSVRLDASLNQVEQQAVAGNAAIKVELESSDPEVGDVAESEVMIGAGTAAGVTEFRPRKAGVTTLRVGVPPGFSAPQQNRAITATVAMAGLSITADLTIGQNLQVGGIAGLGERAPEGGVTVTLTSSDPQKLLLSASLTQVGSETLKLQIPAGGVSAPFFLQAVGDSGTVTYTASALGYRSRTAQVGLAPSGVVIAPKHYGPPDEAELLRKEAEEPRGVVTLLSKKRKVPLAVWVAQLDPATRRSADITVQPLGPRAPLKVLVKSSNPAVGKVLSPVTIMPGAEFALTDFLPASTGSTVISVQTPQGFSESSNSTSFTAVVRP